MNKILKSIALVSLTLSSGVAFATSNAEKVAEQDPSGMGMALTAMSVVFLALIVLYLIFKFLGKGFVNSKQKSDAAASAAAAMPKSDNMDDVACAIATAIALYQQEKNFSGARLTRGSTAKAYSPWNSKIYSLRKLPQKKR